ncbi:hypothetical protein Dsin_008746 [Dipteronia sinensis]|uniref:DUF659 domain-containing protein n=1 Tax=Dipteronia sinensis TaxID=43782 RepID=A0AAE0EB35_9ROSI|nr:hypothetical protein Dsin_008746 [Dipteronia sinensis]
MFPDERDDYRSAIDASKASEWKREQEARIFGGRSKRGKGSGAGGSSQPPQQVRRTQSGREPHYKLLVAPSLYKSSGAKQKNIKDMFEEGSIREKMGRLVSKFFIYDNMPPHKADSHHFKNKIIGAQELGVGAQPPSTHEIRHQYLEIEYKEMKEYVDNFKNKWDKYCCTIICDGWTGPTRLSIINFMVYCKGRTIFLKSVDASNKIKDHQYIYGLIKDVVKEVGEKNVVQIITDNGFAFVKAGKKLMKKYSLFWTPCAAHCIDLIFKDIGKKDIVASVIHDGKAVTNFIYNHGWLLSQIREVCKGEIVRSGATRFATNHIALDSLLKKIKI